MKNLAGVTQILWAAKIDAVADQWHLDRRALPSLTALAERMQKPELTEAVQHTVKASELLVAAKDAMAEAIALIDDVNGLQPPRTTAATSSA